MKTAVSIPDRVFSRAEAFARRRRISRSALYSAAIEEYVQQHTRDDITRKLDEVYGKADSSLDPVLAQMQLRSLPREQW